ncbi:MAG: ribonuclease P protein component, partial [Calditrichaeota bacterium]|nr:ribonuclease P protein component [Calditrichota bacterium]
MPAPERKVAFVATRGVGGAVQRNRAQRKLREIFRHNKSLFPDKYHYLLVLRNEPSDWH